MVCGNFWARVQKYGGLGNGWDGALVMRQPSDALRRISCPLRSLFTLGIWCIISVVLVSGSLCSGRLGVADEYENEILGEITVFVGATLGSTVDTCSASVLWWLWTYFTHFLTCGRLKS